MNTPLAMRIERELEIDEGFFMTLQVFYDIKKEKNNQSQKFHPSFSKLRPALFWGTKMENIIWDWQKKSVTKSVFERGNLTEKKLLDFYGQNTIRGILTAEKDTIA